ncbi:MAG: ROK family transcriptional regulator [Eubacteriales bacterium]|jgi:predicted NBD/HSP70 family sugar kinase
MIYKGSNQSDVKKSNAALIREAIYRYAPISRVELSQKLGLTPPTVAATVNKLISEKVVCELGSTNTDSYGRKPILVDFIPDSLLALGIELGPYRTTLILTDFRGKVLYQRNLSSAPKNYESMIDFISVAIKKLIAENNIPIKNLIGLGIGLPGFIDSDKGYIYQSPRHNWSDKHLAKDIQEQLSMTVCIENNVRARAIGAELFDRSISTDYFLYLFVSRGLACPLIEKSSLYYGKIAGAGEIGHSVISVNGPKCEACGNYGCLEAVASENAIVNQCKNIMKNGLPTMLNILCNDSDNLEMNEILLAQDSGDIYVGEVLRSAVTFIGVSLSNNINFVRPRHVLVDGQIFNSVSNQNLLLDVVRKNVYGRNNTDFIFLPYNPLRGAIGGAAIAIEYFLRNASPD